MTPRLPPEAPDAHLVAHHARARRAQRRCLLWAIGLTGIVTTATVGWVVRYPEDWEWAVPVGLLLDLVAATVGLFGFDHTPPRRPEPDTPRELGRLIGAAVVDWAGNSAGRHDIRFVLEPLGRPGTLVHGHGRVDAVAPDIPFGTLLGFRRHPTTRHLVHLTEDAPSAAVVVAATAADPESAQRSLSTGTLDVAQIVDVTVADGTADGRWYVDVALELASRRRGRARCLVTPELLAVVPVAARVAVVCHETASDWVLLFPAAGVRPGK